MIRQREGAALTKYKGELLLLITAIMWGSGFVGMAIGLEHFTVFQLMAGRFTLATILLCVIFYKKLQLLNWSIIWKGALLGGIIGNSIKNSTQQEMITDFANHTESEVISFVPRSPTVTRCELDGVTTIEGAPDSAQAEVYRELARKVINNENKLKPKPFYGDDLSEWGSIWINKLLLNEKIERDNLQFDGSGI